MLTGVTHLETFIQKLLKIFFFPFPGRFSDSGVQKTAPRLISMFLLWLCGHILHFLSAAAKGGELDPPSKKSNLSTGFVSNGTGKSMHTHVSLLSLRLL